jgi:starch synthase (maltosyl-transferring)
MASRPPRVVVERTAPEVACGHAPIKRTVGEKVVVEADVYAEGHDLVTVVLRWRRESAAEWTEVEMGPLGNDRWRASFPISSLEPHRYVVEGCVDAFRTWRRGLSKKLDAGTLEAVDLLVGAELLDDAAARASGEDASALSAAAAALREEGSLEARARRGVDDALAAVAARHPDRSHATRGRELAVNVERERGATAIGERLRNLGSLQKLVLVERTERGDDRLFTYELQFPDRAMYFTVGIAPDNRVSQFQLRAK